MEERNISNKHNSLTDPYFLLSSMKFETVEKTSVFFHQAIETRVDSSLGEQQMLCECPNSFWNFHKRFAIVKRDRSRNDCENKKRESRAL